MKGGGAMEQKLIQRLREEYPNHIPLRLAAELLGVSERQLARLVADGREPFARIGANIGTRQRYVRVYTERLIAYLSGERMYE
jgi:AraC-like DNA-binding protein